MGAARATGGSGWTTDQHGRRVTLLDPYPLLLLRRFDRIDEAGLEAILADLGGEYAHITRNIRLGIWSLVAAVGITVVGLGVSVVGQGPGAWRDLLSTVASPTMLPIFIAAIGGGVVAPWFAMRAKRFERLRGVMLAHRRCPHCGYGIGSVPATEGAVICPECAAAWPAGEVGVPVTTPVTDSARERTLVVLLLVGLGVAAVLAGFAVFLVY